MREPPDPSPCIRWSGFLGPAKGVRICTIRSLDKSSNYAPRPRSIGTARRVEAFAQRSPSRPDPQYCDQQHGCNAATLNRRPLLSRRLSADKENGSPGLVWPKRRPCKYSIGKCRLALVHRLPFYVDLHLRQFHADLYPNPTHFVPQRRGNSIVPSSIVQSSSARIAGSARCPIAT